MFNLENIVKDFAKEKNVELNSFILIRIRGIQRNHKDMSPEDIIKALSRENKLFMAFNRQDWKRLEEIIKKAR